jgi:hypothetical protein
MRNPYAVDPGKQVPLKEQAVVTLKDDTARPPATIGKPIWQSLLFGSALGQPSGDEPRRASRSLRILGALLLAVLLLGLAVAAVRILSKGF